MAVLPILTYPNSLLKTVSTAVESFDSDLQQLFIDLNDTLDASPGCVGIAAPQVGVLKRVILVDVSNHPKATSNHGRMMLINPNIIWQEGEIVAREGCLSLPNLTANVKRAQRIKLTCLDGNGRERSIETCDFEARVILHETDHLDGLLFLDRVSSLKTDVFRRKRFQPTSDAAPVSIPTER